MFTITTVRPFFVRVPQNVHGESLAPFVPYELTKVNDNGSSQVVEKSEDFKSLQAEAKNLNDRFCGEMMAIYI